MKRTNQPCISLRWVCLTKQTKEGLKLKARLVARGFEEECLSKSEIQSPTCSKDTFRLILSLTEQKRWNISCIDIKTAFLQGESMDRDVFIIPPPESNCLPDHIFKLEKCAYGLSDASLKWYQKVKSFVLLNKGYLSEIDPSLFIWYSNEKTLLGYILIHVDNFLFAGVKEFHNSIIKRLKSTFAIGKEEKTNFRYLGLNICSHLDNITLDQHQYIQNINKIDINPERKISPKSPLTSGKKDILRSKIGQLLWINNQTRPDISFDVSYLASALNTATVTEMIQCNKIITKVGNNSYELKYSSLKGKPRLNVYTDASYGNLQNGGSQGGYLIFIVGEDNTFNLLSWESKQLKRIARSTLTAETISLVDGVESAICIKQLFKEPYCYIPIDVFTDNRSLVDALKSSKYVGEKILCIDMAALKSYLYEKNIATIKWVNSANQLADILTKKNINSLQFVKLLHNGYF